jgi:transposase
VAVQKQLLPLCFALWRSGAKYQPNYHALDVGDGTAAKKIVPLSGTTQNQSALVGLFLGKPKILKKP